MSPKEAGELVKKSQNYEQVIRVKDFDSNHYVVEAIPFANKFTRGAQTLFGVNKNNGEVTAFYLNFGDNYNLYTKASECKLE